MTDVDKKADVTKTQQSYSFKKMKLIDLPLTDLPPH